MTSLSANKLGQERIFFAFRSNFSSKTQRVVPSGQDSSILPAWVANHRTGFGSSCPLTELQPYNKGIYEVILLDQLLEKQMQDINRQLIVKPAIFSVKSSCRREIVIICWRTPSAHCKTTKVFSQRFNRLHQFHWKNESPCGRCSCFNGCNEPVYEHATRGGNPNSMHGIRNILLKQTSNPKSTTGTSPKPLIFQENSFQFNGKKTTCKYMAQPWAQRWQ